MNQFFAVEAGLIVMYIFNLLYILKKDKDMLLFFISSTFYAILFENMNILFSSNSPGGYFYNKEFLLFIFDLPVFVALAWSIIIYTSIKIARSLNIKAESIPFAAALIVLLVDLAIDVVAIRLNYWTWIGYSFKDGYFGVPAGNFLGWLLVSFAWFFFDQKIRFKKQWVKYLFLPFLSYFAFLTLFIFVTYFNALLNFDKTKEFISLLIIITIFLFSIKIGANSQKTDLMIYLLRAPFYLFGLFFLIEKKMYEESIFLLLLSIFFIIIEISIFLGEKSVYRKNKK